MHLGYIKCIAEHTALKPELRDREQQDAQIPAITAQWAAGFPGGQPNAFQQAQFDRQLAGMHQAGPDAVNQCSSSRALHSLPPQLNLSTIEVSSWHYSCGLRDKPRMCRLAPRPAPHFKLSFLKLKAIL